MPKNKFYENQAKSIINKLQARKMEGYYCPDRESAKNKILELIGGGKKVVTYGGSVTLDEIGIKEEVEHAGHELLRREQYITEEARAQCYAKQTMADVYMMSTNAITLDGELVNIDGAGNRVACLIHGPKEVIVVTG
ncbi:MAG: lactate utilization protein, partial [Agathobacter sp.]|nr:lactate utilization protein [Agathobacter sp.]